MPYSVKPAPDNLPAIIVLTNSEFSVKDELKALLSEVKRVLDKAEGPVYYINDLTDLKIGFSDLISSMSQGTQGSTGVLRHPNIKEFLFISNSQIANLGISAMEQVQYGELSVRSVNSVEDALTYVREQTSD